jgi:hypothetical protein
MVYHGKAPMLLVTTMLTTAHNTWKLYRHWQVPTLVLHGTVAGRTGRSPLHSALQLGDRGRRNVMKIVVLDAHPLSEDASDWAPLKALGEVEVYDHSSDEQVQAGARDAAVLITNRAPVTARVIEQAPALRLIAVSFTGYDCVDVWAARRRGIIVANVPTYGTESVAQFVLALLLELCHHVGLHDQAVSVTGCGSAARPAAGAI